MASPDLSVFSRIKTKADFDRENEAYQLERAAKIAALQQAQQVDATKLGEQAFMKAAQGIPLTPQEEAAAKLMDAKSGGMSFNPVTGEIMQKPRISDKIGLGGQNLGNQDLGIVSPTVDQVAQNIPKLTAGQIDESMLKPKSQIDINYEQQMEAMKGNPKAQQALTVTYNAEKIKANDEQAKAAGFADRMSKSLNNIDPTSEVDPLEEVGTSYWENFKSKIPVVGTGLTSEEFQLADQAKRDFINALMRRESGAAIMPSEFENANIQYFPVPGNTPAVLKQKAENRKTALEAINRSAGQSYVPKELLSNSGQNTNNAVELPTVGTVDNGYVFTGGNPADKNSWKKVK